MPDTRTYAPVASAPRSATRNILCIDAEDESRLLIAEILYEHEVDFALTADDAVQLAHYRPYDLYLLDPSLPGFNDFDLVRELRRYDAHVPLVICTSSDRLLAADEVVQARLEKPLAPRAVRETATRLLLRGLPNPIYRLKPPDAVAAR